MDNNVVHQHERRSILSSVTVEPVLLLSCSVLYFIGTLTNEYVFHRLALDHGLQNASHSELCNDSQSGSNSSSHEVEELVSSEAAKWNVYITVPGLILATFTAAIIGTWTDSVGRKPGLIISSLGLVVMTSVLSISMAFNLPLYTIIISYLSFNFCGGFPLLFACCFAYLSDVTPKHKLTFAIGVGELMTGFGGAFANAAGGIMIQRVGFFAPAALLFGISVTNLFYVVLRLQSGRCTCKHFMNLLLCKSVGTFIHFIKRLLGENSFWKIIVYLIAFFLYVVGVIGMISVLVLFLISYPFCLSSITVGFVQAGFAVGWFVIIPLTRVFTNPKEECVLFIASVLLSILGMTAVALTHIIAVVYLGLALCVMVRVGFPIFRSQLSRLVSKENQGALFSALAIIESVGSLTASLVFGEVYSLTAKTEMPGAAFFLSVLFSVLLIPIYAFVFWKSKNEMEAGYSSLATNVNEDVET